MKKKVIQIGREVKLSPYADDKILFIENPKDFTKKKKNLIIMNIESCITQKVNFKISCFYPPTVN